MPTSSTYDVSVGLPLMMGAGITFLTVVIHGLALLGIVYLVRYQYRQGRTGVRFWEDLATVTGTTLLAGVAHLIEIVIWAMFFVLCGESSRLAAAIYSSATLYTSLGYGDVVMSSSWKLLGPFETADGWLMFGITTAMTISVIQLMVRTRFHDLPNF